MTTHRTLLISGTSKLNLPLLVEADDVPLLFSSPIQQRLATTISAALATASKTTWSQFALGPVRLGDEEEFNCGEFGRRCGDDCCGCCIILGLPNVWCCCCLSIPPLQSGVCATSIPLVVVVSHNPFRSDSFKLFYLMGSKSISIHDTNSIFDRMLFLLCSIDNRISVAKNLWLSEVRCNAERLSTSMAMPIASIDLMVLPNFVFSGS